MGDGKYCAQNSNHPNVQGASIIREDLRAQYVYEKAYSGDQAQRETYWNYMQQVEKRCYGETHSY